MANYKSTGIYTENVRKLEPTDPAAAELFNSILGQIFNNTAAIKVLAEQPTTPAKIAGAKANLLDLSKCTHQVISSDGTGEILDDEDFTLTDYMPCIPGQKIWCPGGNRRRVNWYDGNKRRVKTEMHGSYPAPGGIIAPDNAVFFRLSYGNSVYDGAPGWDNLNSMICIGVDSYPTEYIPYGVADVNWLQVSVADKAITLSKMADTQENLLTLSRCIPGRLSAATGDIATNATNYFTSDFIDLSSGQSFSYPDGEDRCICYYDSQKHYLSSESNTGWTTQTFTSTMPESAKYLRISWKTSGFDVWNPMLIKGNTYSSKYINPGITLAWLEHNPLQGKKLAVLGDSICALHKSYITTVGYQNNMDFDRQTHNQSIWGSPIARHNSATNPASFLERFSLLRDTTDYLIIHGGVNDCGINVPIGLLTAWDDFTGDLNEYTFIGALESLFRQAQAKYIGAKIIFVANYKLMHLPKLGEYMDAAKRVCNKYSVPVLDFFNSSGLNIGLPSVKTKYWSDDTHLNEWGHLQLVPAATSFLSSCGTISASEIPKQAQNWKKEIGRAISIYAENESQLEITAKIMAAETPPTAGDKSASNPSTISGISALKVTVCGANLFDETVLSRYAKSQTDTEYTFACNGLSGKTLTPDTAFLSNTQYTLLHIAKQTSGNPRLRIAFTDGTYTDVKPSISTEYEIIKYTTPANKTVKYLTSTYSTNGGDWNIRKNSVCLVKGTTLPSYIPYRGTTYNIPLPSTAWGLPGYEDIIDLNNRKLIHRTGYIASYNGEDVGGNYLSSTGGLDIGAQIIYALPEAIEEPLNNISIIRALPFPDKYTATRTTVMSRDGILSVGFAENTAALMDELKNAIINLGGTVHV